MTLDCSVINWGGGGDAFKLFRTQKQDTVLFFGTTMKHSYHSYLMITIVTVINSFKRNNMNFLFKIITIGSNVSACLFQTPILIIVSAGHVLNNE